MKTHNISKHLLHKNGIKLIKMSEIPIQSMWSVSSTSTQNPTTKKNVSSVTENQSERVISQKQSGYDKSEKKTWI